MEDIKEQLDIVEKRLSRIIEYVDNDNIDKFSLSVDLKGLEICLSTLGIMIHSEGLNK